MTIIKLLGTASGVPTQFDGKYVVAYDPTVRDPDGSYNGGILEVTEDPARALRFADGAAALEAWRKSFGLRPDGQPNRPLTAWSVEITSADESTGGN